MVGIPIAFTLARKSILPIVTVTGVSKPIPGIEKFMLYSKIVISYIKKEGVIWIF